MFDKVSKFILECKGDDSAEFSLTGEYDLNMFLETLEKYFGEPREFYMEENKVTHVYIFPSTDNCIVYVEVSYTVISPNKILNPSIYVKTTWVE